MATDNTEMVQREKEEVEHVSTTPRLAPPVDVYENADELLLMADVPGVEKDALDIRLDGGELTFEAKQTELGEGDETYQAVLFTRSFTLPSTIDVNQVAAELTDGVLTVRLPKSEAAKPRRIAVKTD